MIHFVSAAYGPEYVVPARGLVRSFSHYCPMAWLHLYTDQPYSSFPTGRVTIDRSLSRKMMEGWLDGDYWRAAKSHVMAHHARTTEPDDNLCWLDADTLVLADLVPLMQPYESRLMVVRYGADGPERRCGGGLIIPQRDYVISGFYSLPGLEACRERLEIIRERRMWLDKDGEGCPDQEGLNHLVHRDGRAIYLDREYPELIWNLAPWGGEHPVPGHITWRQLDVIQGRLTFDAKPFALFYWLVSCLAPQLKTDFRDVLIPRAAKFLRDMYVD